jgi:hypothetical protein
MSTLNLTRLNVTTVSNLDASSSVPIADVINGTARVWVNFNGVGVVAIRASYNVSSITDNGTGDFTINFTNALTDANCSGVVSSNANTTRLYSTGAPFTSTTMRVETFNSSNASTDYAYNTAAIFR